jgi:hypothetical protein
MPLGGGGGAEATPWPFYSRERDAVPIAQESGWASGPVWTGAENLTLSGITAPTYAARSESLYVTLSRRR